jgi:hypothetical protein
VAADGERAHRSITRIASYRIAITSKRADHTFDAIEKNIPIPLNKATTMVIVAEVRALDRGAHLSRTEGGGKRMPAKKKKKAAKKAPAKKKAAKKKGGAKKKKR